MRIRKLGITLSAGLLLAIPCSAQQPTPAGEAKAVLERAMALFNARDYTEYGSHFTDDMEAYTGVYTPLRFVGKAQWLAFIRGLENYAAASYVQREPVCRAYNNDAVLCNAYFVFSTTTRGGVTEVQSGRESSALVRVGGRWLIANHHFSHLF